jgi:predicted GTPase
MKQKQMFSDGEELATSLARIFDRNLKMTDWPDVDCELKQCHVADNYKEKMEVLQNVIRSSASTVCSEHALDPLRACIARVVPEVEQLKSEREVKLTDYDSYRRRLKEKETKKEQLDVSCPLHVPSILCVRFAACVFSTIMRLHSGCITRSVAHPGGAISSTPCVRSTGYAA